MLSEEGLLGYQLHITLGPAIAEELPGVAHFANHVEIQISNHQCVFVARRLGDDLTARIAEIALAIELADVPRHFMTDAINCTDEISVGYRVSRLLQLPEIF